MCFVDRKVQKISQDGQQKVRIILVLNEGYSTTFHFVNKNGHSEQIADRDKVKELLLQLLPNFKPKIDKEMEEQIRF